MPEKQKAVTIVTEKVDKNSLRNAHAFLLDSQGKLIEQAPLSSGEAKLKTMAEALGAKSRLFIGNALPKEIAGRPVTASLLTRSGAKEIPFHLSADNKIIVSKIPPILHFPFDWCTIKGSVTKSFTIDNQVEVLPVCHARVHICEVDPIIWWWPKLPDYILSDLINRLREVVRIPIPIPNPDPGPIRVKIPPINPAAWLPGIGNPVPNIPVFSKSMNIRPAMMTSGMRNTSINLNSLPPLPENVKSGILSPSLSVAQNTIINNISLFHPYICWWPVFWPWLYKCDEIAVVETDCLGKFDYNYLYFSNSDKPDIYVWVEVNINGEWVTVYKPSIPCGTDWDYVCGTDINLRLTDSRIKPCSCDPLPGSIIWIKNVNTATSIRSIQQNTLASGNQTNAIGLKPIYYGGMEYNISPFGSQFPFVVEFGSGFPNSTVSHYRWKYRRIKDAFLNDVTDSFHYLEGEIGKPYRYELPDGNFATKNYRLGADYNGTVPKYKIPHVNATDDVPEPTALWYELDTYSIYVNSPNFSNGLYEFVFELTDNAGNVVNVPAETYVVTRKAGDPPPMDPHEVTIKADGLAENYLIKSGTQASAFRFFMRIDNQKCYANVIDALVGTGTTDTECGFGYFDEVNHKATLRYFGGHPQNFGYYSFTVTKGNSNPVTVANAAQLASIPDNGYSKSSVMDADHGFAIEDFYQKQFDVNELLGTCPQAAFAEYIYLWATHTDGTNRLQGYDASDIAAIAIAPKP